MEEARQKYEELVRRKDELQKIAQNTRETVDKLRRNVDELSHEMSKQYLIEKCSSAENSTQVSPVPQHEALHILKYLEENPSLIDEVIVALVQRKATLTGQLSHLQEKIHSVTEASPDKTEL